MIPILFSIAGCIQVSHVFWALSAQMFIAEKGADMLLSIGSLYGARASVQPDRSCFLAPSVCPNEHCKQDEWQIRSIGIRWLLRRVQDIRACAILAIAIWKSDA
ncbi:MAG TPA: hypothetical protein DHW02_23275 [Ktedonobacter sp.]|nr:hypothetical protein [Ktedonobacter sp.]